MARVRSPNYPGIGLSEAISRIKIIHQKEQHLAAPREVIAQHLGYKGISGASDKTVSALIKYGLLEDVGDKLKVSSLALEILHPSNPEAKAKAISEAAFKPALFAEIHAEWSGAAPSDENLRSYLIRKQFAIDAIDRVIESYRDTIDLVTREGSDYNSSDNNPDSGENNMQSQSQSQSGGSPTHKMPQIPTGVLSDNILQVSMSGDRLDVSASLLDAEGVAKLVKILEANKALLPVKAN